MAVDAMIMMDRHHVVAVMGLEKRNINQGVAQLSSASDLESEGRECESHHPDTLST